MKTTTASGNGKVQGTESQSKKPGHAEVKTAEILGPVNIENLQAGKGNDNKIIPLKKKMNIGEKIDAMKKLESLSKKLGHLKQMKENLDLFATGPQGWEGARLLLETNEDEIPVKNTAIVQELISISKMRVQEGIILTEKEIEAFEII